MVQSGLSIHGAISTIQVQFKSIFINGQASAPKQGINILTKNEKIERDLPEREVEVRL